MKPGRPDQRRTGFTLLELIVTVVILAIFMAALFPALLPARKRVKRIGCVNNLKQISFSFHQWGMDNNDEYPYQVSVTNGGTMELVGNGLAYVHFLVLSNELNTPRLLICPNDTNRPVATNWAALRNGNLSYFVGLDTTVPLPQLILSGDDHFTVNGAKPKRGLVELWTNSQVAWPPARHNRSGYVAFANGSVQGFSTSGFQQALVGTGMATNRLLMP